MKNRFLEGVLFGLGFLLILGFIGIVTAIGFHTAEEILPGTFSGDYNFVSGNVGIGTTNPNSDFEIHNSASPTIRVSSNGNDGDVSNIIFSYLSTSYEYARLIGIKQTGGGGHLAFATADGATISSEKMRVTANGNVGIGTANPIGKLQVNDGNIILATDSNHRIRFYDSAALTEKCNIRPRSTGNCGANGESTLVSGPTYDLCGVCY